MWLREYSQSLAVPDLPEPAQGVSALRYGSVTIADIASNHSCSSISPRSSRSSTAATSRQARSLSGA